MYFPQVVIGSIVCSLLASIINIHEYLQSGIVTSIYTTTAPLNDATFPSLALCNVNQVTQSFLLKLGIQDKDVNKKDLLFKQYIKGISPKKPLNQTEENTLREINEKLSKEYGGRKFKPFWYSSQDCR